MRLVSNRCTGLLNCRYRTMAVLCTARHKLIRPGFRCKQQCFQIWLLEFPQSPPLFNRHKHRRFHAALSHNLGPFVGACFKKRTEPGFSLPNLPCLAHVPPPES